GPEPLPDDEVEQHLTISASGRIWFTGYKYGNGFGQFEISRKQQFNIGKSAVKEILELFSQYIESEQLTYYATDIGTWEMKITDTDGKSHNFKGALCGGVTVGDTDLTYYLREQIPIQNLFVFEDNLMEPDENQNGL
ncbi:MAG: hypothetical protein WBI31_07705, partial [Thermacetogeniaceae bacterium]